MTTIGLGLVALFVLIVVFQATRNVLGAWAVMGGVVTLLLVREIWLWAKEENE